MGRLRSSKGCSTCRRRHVKCNEAKPVCQHCERRGTPCNYGDAFRFVVQQPTQRSPITSMRSPDADALYASTPSQASQGVPSGISRSDGKDYANYAGHFGTLAAQGCDTHSRGQSSVSYASTSPSALFTDLNGMTSEVASPAVSAAAPGLSRNDALQLHHFSTHLARWLDCTDSARHFALRVTRLACVEPVLLHAVKCFVARHKKQTKAAADSHEQCVQLLIPRLAAAGVAHDDTILCAIVILRVFEQLDVIDGGSDEERHLAGCSALLRSSSGLRLDYSASSLRQAAFWVYVRQTMYNSCVYQQPLDIDVDNDTGPLPEQASELQSDALAVESAWSNALVWLTAKILHFCFQHDFRGLSDRMSSWRQLARELADWETRRPSSFTATWEETRPGLNGSIFPTIFFIADWHVMSYGFLQLAHILLMLYKPSPRFAIHRSSASLSAAETQKILDRARLICGAAQSNQHVIPSMITLCHTCFIWGPLMTEPLEQEALTGMLVQFEYEHSWPTTWIIKALRTQWGHDDIEPT